MMLAGSSVIFYEAGSREALDGKTNQSPLFQKLNAEHYCWAREQLAAFTIYF